MRHLLLTICTLLLLITFGNSQNLNYQISYNDSLCEGNSGNLIITYQDTILYDSITWQGSNYSIIDSLSIQYQPTSDTFYLCNFHFPDTIISDSFPVWVIPYPIASFTFSPDSICANQPIQFTNTSQGMVSCQWDFGQLGMGSTQTDPSYVYQHNANTPTTFTIDLDATGENGCQSSVSNTIYILPAPDPIDFSVYDPNTFNNCMESDTFHLQVFNSSSTQNTNTNFTIDWGEGSSESYGTWPFASEKSHSYINTGLYHLVINIDNSFGCSNYSTQEVFFGSNPAITLGNPGSTTLLCAPQEYVFPIDFYNPQGEENPDGTVYTISFNDGSADLSFVHPPPDSIAHLFEFSSCGYNSDNYENAFGIKILAENPCGSSSSSIDPIVLKEQSGADFLIDPGNDVCMGELVTFTNNSYDGNNVSYTGGTYACDTDLVFNWTIVPPTGWTTIYPNDELGTDPANFNNPFFQNGDEELDVIFDLPGTYIVTLKVDNSCQPMDQYSDTIIVDGPPTPSVMASLTSGCAPLTVNFTNNSTGLNLSHNWIVDPSNNVQFNNSTQESEEPTIKFNEAGHYSVTYTITNPCGELDTTISINVYGAPAIYLPNFNDMCEAIPVTTQASYTDNLSPISSIQWDISPTIGYSLNGSTLNDTNITIDFSDYGTYTIMVSAQNYCGTDTAEKQINILPVPEFYIEGDSAICQNDSAHFEGIVTNGYTNISFLWSDQSTDTTLQVQSQTSAWYFLTVSNSGGCSAIDSTYLTIDPIPTVNAGPDLEYCIDWPPDTLLALPANGSWSGTGIINTDGVYFPDSAGIGNFNLTYFYTDPVSECYNSDQILATVNPLPTVDAGQDTTFCDQAIVAQLEGASPPYGEWLGTGLNPNGQFLPNGTGSFEMVYTYTDNNSCLNRDTLVVTVDTLTHADAGSDHEICFDAQSINLSGYPNYGTWTENAISPQGQYTFASPGTFHFYFQIGEGTCYDRDTMQLTIHALPEVNAGINQTYCIDSQADTLLAWPANGTWSGPGVMDSTGIYHPYSAGIGNFNLTYSFTDSVTGCQNSDQIQATVYPLPTVNAGQDTTFCDQAIAAQLEGAFPLNGYWTGTGIDSSGLFTPNGIGSFEMVYHYTDNHSCKNYDTLMVMVDTLTHADAGANLEACIDAQSINLSGYPSNGTWSGNSITPQGEYTFTSPGQYLFYFDVGTGTCYNRDTTQLTIHALPEVNAGANQEYCIDWQVDTLQATPANGSWSGTGIFDAVGFYLPDSAGIGNFNLTYSFTDSVTGCQNSDQIQVTVYPLPIVNAGQDTSFCDQAIAAQLEGATPPNGSWTGTGINPSGEFIPNGTDTLWMVYDYTDNNGCKNKDSLTVIVDTLTHAHAGTDIEACIDVQTINLTGFPTNGTWDGNAISQQGQYNLTNPGVFNFYFEIGEGTCHDKDTMQLTVHALPLVNAGANQEYCIDWEADTLLASPTNGSWNGPGIFDPVGFYHPDSSGIGNFNLTYSYTDSVTGCANSDQIQATVYPLPIVKAGQDTNFCDQAIAAQLEGFSPQNGTWSGTGINPSGEFVPNGTGSFCMVYAYIDNHGCKNKDSITVTVDTLTHAQAGMDTALCFDVNQIVLQGLPSSGQWDNNGIASSGLYNFTNDGQFDFYYHLGEGTCFDQDTMTLTVHPLPTINLPADFDICFNAQDTNLSEMPYGGTWSGPGITDIDEGWFGISEAGLGSHQISYAYTDTSTGCDNSKDLIVSVRPLPISAFSLDSPMCVNMDTFPTNLSTGASQYQWFSNESLISQATEPVINFNDTGYIDLALVAITQYGCSDTSRASTYVIDKPKALFSLTPNTGCEPLEVGFNNNSEGDSWSSFWDFGNGQLSPYSDPPNMVFETDGVHDEVFYITLSEKNKCGRSDFTDSVQVFGTPQIDFGTLDSTGCEPFKLDLSGVYVDQPLAVNWNFGDGTTSDSLVDNHYYLSDGIYPLMVRIYGPESCIPPEGVEYTSTIVVFDTPDVKVNPEHPEICKGDIANLEISGGIEYQLSNNQGLDSLIEGSLMALAQKPPPNMCLQEPMKTTARTVPISRFLLKSNPLLTWATTPALTKGKLLCSRAAILFTKPIGQQAKRHSKS